MGYNDRHNPVDPGYRQPDSVGANRYPRDYSRYDRCLVVGRTEADALTTHGDGAVRIVMAVIDAEVEQRWMAATRASAKEPIVQFGTAD